MTMDVIVTVMEVLFVILIACVIAYTHKTNRIIKDQEKEITILRTKNTRLKVAYLGARRKCSPKIVEIKDTTIDPDNVPDFGKEW